MKRRNIILVATMLILVLVFCTGCSIFGSNIDDIANNKTSSATTNISKSVLEAELAKYREIAETLNGRVTSLEEIVGQMTSTTKQNIGSYATTLVDSVMSIRCVEERYNLATSATGFIISQDGYVLTNNHVVSYEAQVIDNTSGSGIWGFYQYKTVTGQYSTITATFDSTSIYHNNGKAYVLECIYRDANYDLAICKLKEAAPVGENWKTIPFFDGTVSRGDELLIVGNAYGFGISATSGLVSATGKTFESNTTLTFIQTDAAINGGNSGGPAINIYGALVGVVNSKFVSTNIENMGFAIELAKVKEFISNAQTATSITVNYETKAAA